jgi:hypothetical protein
MRRLTALALVTIALLSGCAQTVPFGAAPDAANPLCAEAIVRMPDVVNDDLQRRQTNSQGTAAWGDPSSALLRCGVPVPGPSTLLCFKVGSGDDVVYWLLDPTDDPKMVYTTYGREPATQVIVDREKATPGVVLLDVSKAVAYTKETRKCTDVEDSLG